MGAPGHREPFVQGLIAGVVLVLGLVLGLGSLAAPFIRGFDLLDLWAPGSLLKIVVAALVVGIVFGVIFVTPTAGTGAPVEGSVRSKDRKADGDAASWRLVCSSCQHVYHIGKDAVVVTAGALHDAAEFSVQLGGGSQPDLVGRREVGADERAEVQATVGRIRRDLEQGRRRQWWCERCQNDKNPHDYPWPADGAPSRAKPSVVSTGDGEVPTDPTEQAKLRLSRSRMQQSIRETDALMQARYPDLMPTEADLDAREAQLARSLPRMEEELGVGHPGDGASADTTDRGAEAFNAGVEWFRAGDYGQAAQAFETVCDDRSALEGLRMAAGYARAVCDQRRGLQPSLPRDFAHRADHMVVQYSLMTAAGLLAHEGLPVARPIDNALVVEVDQGEVSLQYRISYQEALGIVMTVVKRFGAGGQVVHLEMEPDPTPQPSDGVILDIAKQAGSGSHDPVRLPTHWARGIVFPSE